MDLKEVIFTDGKIVSYSSSPRGLRVEFRDYAGDVLELLFTGDVDYVDNDSVGYDLADSKLSSNAGRFRLELFDDEGAAVFAVDFDRGIYMRKEKHQ